MDLRQLRYFVAIAEHGNFHRASEALNVAQSALSRHMQTLGEELGAPLFERAPGGVTTTILGKVFYAEAKGILERADSAVERSRKAVAGKIGRLVIGVNEIAARHPTFIAAIALSRRRYPEVELAVERMNSPEQVEALWAGKLDLGVLIDRPSDPEFGWMRLCTDTFMVGMHAGHRLANREELMPTDLAGEDFVAMRLTRYGPAQAQIFAACRQLGFMPTVVQEAANEQMQLSLICHGLGVGFVTRSAELVKGDQIRLLPLRGFAYELNLDLMWLRHKPPQPLQHLLAIFRELLAAAPDALPRPVMATRTGLAAAQCREAG